MTVSYSLEVSNAHLGGFLKLLLRWKGSIYRLMAKEFLIFLCLFYSIAAIYRFALDRDQQRQFEQIAKYAEKFTDNVPVTFVLGFFVTLVVGRWWNVFLSLPYPDRCAFKVATFIRGSDERARVVRRTLMRYVNLMSTLTMQNTSMAVKKRFPTMDHLVEAGLMTKAEKEMLDKSVCPLGGSYFIPASWFCNLVYECRNEGRISSDTYTNQLIEEVLTFRKDCHTILGYDWVSIPLVYTQVVTISVYSYFLACLFGQQYMYVHADEQGNNNGLHSTEDFHNNPVSKFVPVYTLFSFFFYMGWLKVAEELVNPLGEDDDDFEVNFLLDRNVQVAYLIVDSLYGQYPAPEKDKFWGEPEPEIPYTAESAGLMTDGHIGSTANINILPCPEYELLGAIPEGELMENGLLTSRERINMTPPGTKPRMVLKRLLSRQSSTTSTHKTSAHPRPVSSRKVSESDNEGPPSRVSSDARMTVLSSLSPATSPCEGEGISFSASMRGGLGSSGNGLSTLKEETSASDMDGSESVSTPSTVREISPTVPEAPPPYQVRSPDVAPLAGEDTVDSDRSVTEENTPFLHATPAYLSQRSTVSYTTNPEE